MKTKKPKPRANKWASFKQSDLSSLGQRLLTLVEAHPSKSPRVFAEEALGGVKSRGGNLSTQLERMVVEPGDDKEHVTLMADQLAAYARAGRVSLFWLITGEGSPTDGPYADVGGPEMQRYPEALRRAIRALIELDGVTLNAAMWAADQIAGGEDRDPNRWLGSLRHILDESGKSGLRPSVKLKISQ